MLQEKDTKSAIATLKAFERLDHKLNCSAAINLSFLYFHERDYLQAAKYVDVASGRRSGRQSGQVVN